MTILNVTLTATMVNLHLSDHSVRGWVLVDPTVSFLFAATVAERNNWQLIEKGAVVTWPELGRSLSAEDLG